MMHAQTIEATEDQDTIMVNDEWQHGDEPQSHPMWEEQLELEEYMQQLGADRIRNQAVELVEKGQQSRLKPVGRALEDNILPVAEGIKRWVKAWGGKRGVKPMHLALVREKVDPYVAAVIGLRRCLDGMNIKGEDGASICMDIGREIEHDCRIKAWSKGSKQERQLYKDHIRHQERNKATSDHLRLASINRFNAYLTDGSFDKLTWDSWSNDTVFRVGWMVLEAILTDSGLFLYAPRPFSADARYRFKANRAPPNVILPSPGFSEWLAQAITDLELHSPSLMPTVMPPKPWGTPKGDGGYWTPYVMGPSLIRFKASSQDQRQGAREEYDALDFPQVYTALNAMQDTGYRINAKVLEVFAKCWTELRWDDEDLRKDKACLPRLTEREMPKRSPAMEEHHDANLGKRGAKRSVPSEALQEEISLWKRRAAEVHTDNAQRAGRTRGASSTLRIAMKFAKYDAIYFPHHLDFRGRYYPTPAYLQPQGNDLSRGLLTYATTAPITRENKGVKWLAIGLANNWGWDKEEMYDRVRLVEEHEDLWFRIAADPYTNDEWFKADNPWQALAHIFEWVAYLNHGDGYECGIPGAQDGTCNGIQHLAAMTRDEVAGQYVNLVPTKKPGDIYKFIAKKLQAKLEEAAEGAGLESQQAAWWLAQCQFDLPRGLTKRQVMVLPYGGTRTSFFEYTWAWIAANLPKLDVEDVEAREWRKGCVVYLTNHMWQTVQENITGPVLVMKWLQEVAAVASKYDQPIFWTVPSGFVVRHFYGVIGTKQVNVTLNGERHQVLIGEPTNVLDKAGQMQGIAPNFTHSLDASALTTCVVLCLELGIRAFTMIHDSYGTHMANMEVLAQCLREAFVWTHQHDVLGSFKSACLDVAESALVYKDGLDPVEAREKLDAELPDDLKMGSLDLELVLESPYFFH